MSGLGLPVKRALTAAGQPVKATAESLAPVNAGELRQDFLISTQLTKSQRKQAGKPTTTTVYVGVGVQAISFRVRCRRPLPTLSLTEAGERAKSTARKGTSSAG